MPDNLLTRGGVLNPASVTGDVVLNTVSVYNNGTVPQQLATREDVQRPFLPPGASFDTTRQAQVGDFYLSSASPRLWSAVAVGANAARWAPQVLGAGSVNLDAAKPIDVLGTTSLIGAFGTVKLASAYTSNCLRVFRSSDNTTLDVGFVKLAMTGGIVEVLDWNAVAAFIAGTTGAVDIWYDQSGSANNVTAGEVASVTGTMAGTTTLTVSAVASGALIPGSYLSGIGVPSGLTIVSQASGTTGSTGTYVVSAVATFAGVAITAVSRPAIGINFIQGIPAVTFYSSAPDSPIYDYFMMCATGTIGNRSLSIWCAGQARPTMTAQGPVSLSSTFRIFCSNSTTNVQATMGISGNSTAMCGSSSPAVFGWITNSSQVITTWCNNRSDATGFLTGGSTNYTGFTVGGDGTAQHCQMDITALLLYNKTMTATDQTRARGSLAVVTNIPPQRADYVVVADGDSITHGTGSTYNQNRTFFERPLYASRSVEIRNIGTHGTTLAARQTNQATIWPSVYLSTARKFIVVPAIGTNDIVSNGTTGAALWTMYQSYCSYIRSLGSNVVIVAATILPRNGMSGAQNTERLAFNALVVANWASIAGALWDGASDPIMGAGAANTTLYGDGTHPTSLGYSYLAQGAASAVLPLMIQ
jgi:lysophospholipase L1-like esterase